VWEHTVIAGIIPPFALPEATAPVTDFLPGGTFGAAG
jgi:hypothetical protein